MRKKILFVINSLKIGGAEKSLISLLSSFNYDCYDVYLLIFKHTGELLKMLPEQVIILPPLDFLQKSSFKDQLLNPGYLVAHLRASLGLRKNSKIQSLHDAQCYWKYAGTAFNTLPEYYDVAIAWGQGNPTHYVAEKVTAGKKFALINADYEAVGHNKDFDYTFYEKYNYIICVSDSLTEIMKKVFPTMSEKILTIYDINNAQLISKMAALNNPFESESADLVLVTVGRLVSPKAYDLAIKAAALLNQRNINFRWYFVGEGPERKTLEQLTETLNVESRIIFVGAKDNPYTYMENANIYVQTSRSEGYCLTLGEARILNKPVISTNFDVVYNQLRDHENGLIVDMTPEAIADAIEMLWSDKDLCEYIVKNIKREKKGNLEEIQKLYDLIEDSIGSSK